jgi:hypothetical protein
MILGYSFLGEGLLTTAFPPKQEYDSTIFTGECYLDNIHMQDIELTDIQIIAATPVQNFGMDTIWLGNFENSLEAGNLLNAGLIIDHWKVYRKLETESIYTYLLTVDYTTRTYIDWLVKNATTYDYLVVSVSDGIQGIGIGGSGMADIEYGWLLQNTTGTTQFHFSVEVNTDDINVVTDVSVIDNYTRYPVVSKGLRRYQKGKITCMLWELSSTGYNGVDSFPQDDLVALEAFINGSEVKYLKNAVGQMWKVETANFSYKYNDEIPVMNSEVPFSVSFEWIEVGSAV